MTDDLRVTQLFGEALELSAEDRDAHLDRTCGTDTSLRQRVESLLTSHAGSRLEVGIRLLDRYEILGAVGAGGFGEVYQAKDLELGRDVAIKTLSRTTDNLGEESRRRFQREIRSLATLSHPNVVAVHDIGRHDGIEFAVMELVDGFSLRQAMTEGPMAWRRVARLGEGIAAALSAAHDLEMMHRDIKPENIMVCKGDQAKVLDFGLARQQQHAPEDFAQNITGDNSILGTVPYMSPEQATGADLTCATDVFSMGVVLFEMATGTNPFLGESIMQTLHLIATLTPPSLTSLNDKVDRSLASLIRQMLDRDAILRPTSAEVLARLRQIDTPIHSLSDSTESKGTTLIENTVGRSEYLTELFRMFESAVSQQGTMVCLAGEAGIGKTTLVDEFVRQLAAGRHTHLLLRGACSERLFGADGLLPLIEALAGLLHGEYSHRGSELMQRLAPGWFVRLASRESLVEFPENELASARAAPQERLKRELLTLVQTLSRSQPLVIVIDDLHWVDASTADMLAYLAARTADLSVLLVAGYRPREMALNNEQFNKTKLDLQSRGLCHEIRLGFLGRHDINDFLSLTYPDNLFTPEFVDLIHRRTEGSPLFVVNLLSYLEEQQVIVQVDGTWQSVDSIPEIHNQLPETMRSMIQMNVERLDKADHELLVAASVQGSEFHGAVVARALERDEVEIEERLEELERVHLFVRTLREEEFPDGTATLRYAFVHVLYQNTLYASLTPARRARLARKVADSLSSLHLGESKRLKVASELAILYEASREFMLAADHFLLASNNAEKNSANQEAITLAKRSIMAANRLQGDDKLTRTLKATFRIARIYMNLGQFDQGERHLDTVIGLTQSAENVDDRVRAMCGKASCLFYMKKLEESRALGEQALQVAKAHNLDTLVAMAESVLATERLCVGDFELAETLYDHSIPVLEQAGESRQALDAMAFRMLMHAWQLNYAPVLRDFDMRQQKTLEQGGNLVQLLFFRAMTVGNQGHLSEAYGVILEARRLAELNDDRYHIPRLPNTEGWLLREMGDLEGAIRVDEESLSLGIELGHDEAAANACVNLAHELTDLGAHDQALERLQQAEQMFEKDVWFRWRYSIRLQAEFSRHYIACGDLQKAELYARMSLEAASKSTARKHIAFASNLLGQIAVLRDDPETARELYSNGLATLSQHSCPSIEWRIHRNFADVERVLHRTHESEIHKQLALESIHFLENSIENTMQRQSFIRRINI